MAEANVVMASTADVFVHVLPTLTGERALRREMFEALTPEFAHGYRIEAGLNSLAKDRGVPVLRFVCPGMWHRPTEEKLGPFRGFVAKVSMLLTAVLAYVLWRVRGPRVPRRKGRALRVRR